MKQAMAMVLSLLVGMGTLLTACNTTTAEPQPNTAVTSQTQAASSNQPIQTAEVYLLAAASLTNVMDELIEEFESQNPHYKIIPNYAASGTLQAQIEQGAPADLFFSASSKQMNALAARRLLVPETQVDLLENKVVLIVPNESKLDLADFAALADPSVKTVALGEFESVPIGAYSKEILNYYGILAQVEAKAVYGTDVRAVLAWVEQGEADAGIVYKTDAMTTPQVHITAEAPAEAFKNPIIYPAAVLTTGLQQQAAKEFLEFCKTPSAAEKFAAYGFDIAYE